MALRLRSYIPQLIAMLMLSAFTLPSYAEELPQPYDSYRLQFGIGANLLWGVAKEIVYKAPTGGTLLSLLLWPMKPLATIGGEIRVINDQDARSLYLRLAVNAAPPTISGTMENFDWLSASPDLTHYSYHENHSECFFTLRLDFGIRLNVQDDFSVIPYMGGMLNTAYWSARNGYLIYPPTYTPSAVEGTGISYSVQILGLLFGVRLEARPADGLYLGLGFELIPLLDVRAVDNHYLRAAIFEDYVYGSIGLSFGLDARFALTRCMMLGFEASFLTVGWGRGDTIHRSTSDPYIQPPPIVGIYYDTAGFAMNLLSLGARLYVVLP